MKVEIPKTVNEVFRTQGQPTFTYVYREEGFYERKLQQSIENRGTICLITGPSKTGKTSLYTRTASALGLHLVTARCDNDLTAKDVWKKALEDVDFDRLTSRKSEKKTSSEVSGEVSGSFGWHWLAGLAGKMGTKLSKERGEEETRERILADANPSHLVHVLKNLPALFVLEDFHYLAPSVQKTVFQQWKVFVDAEVSIVIVGTTHHAVDLAYANKELIGRLSHIDVPTWRSGDLRSIAEQGFGVMNVSASSDTLSTIARESVGLPIVTQAVCLEMLLRRDITQPQNSSSTTSVTTAEAFEALHAVAIEKFGVFSAIYDRLSLGLKKRRKYRTYELILLSFTYGELTFSSTRWQIAERMSKLEIPKEEIPPPALLARTLQSLGALQEKMDVQLLEWRKQDEKLYIIEPTFLFYLRWRTPKKRPPSLIEILFEFKNLAQAVLGSKFDTKGARLGMKAWSLGTKVGNDAGVIDAEYVEVEDEK
jgi:hypothetical protein